VKNVSHEKTIHTCQIPQRLSEMLISSCTMPGDNVLILFGGSGAEVDVCMRLERNFIAAELDSDYYQMIVDRISSGQIDSKYKLDCALPDAARKQNDEAAQLQLIS
jgi:site-specific DNA-methyltransferase (adenine-specific)